MLHFGFNNRSLPIQVDVGIDFKVDPQQRVANSALTREFLERHSAEVVCGPVELANFVDLSGRGGLVTLTSPKLLRIKTKSFLLHIKALPCERPPSPLQREKVAKTVRYGAIHGSSNTCFRILLYISLSCISC